MAHASNRHGWKILYIVCFLKPYSLSSPVNDFIVQCIDFIEQCIDFVVQCIDFIVQCKQWKYLSVSSSLCGVALPVILYLPVCSLWIVTQIRKLYLMTCFHSIDRDQYQLGTLSHILNNKTTGYKDLPEWPQEAPDPSVRNVEIPVPEVTTKKSERKKAAKDKSFYSESETSSEGMVSS